MSSKASLPNIEPLAFGRTDIDSHDRDIYREHGLPSWTLHYTYSGLGRISHQHEHYLSQPGDLLLHKPHIKSDYGIEDSQQQWTHLWSTFHMPRKWLEIMHWPEIFPGIYCVHITQEFLRQQIEQLLLSMIDFFNSPLAHKQHICTSLLHSLLVCADSQQGGHANRALDARIHDAMQFMHDHLQHPLQLEQLAEQAHLSTSRFAHLFREQMDIAPMQYLEQARMRRAGNELIMSNKPIAEIAEECGFQDPAYFTRLFRRHFHMTPRAYRKKSLSRG